MRLLLALLVAATLMCVPSVSTADDNLFSPRRELAVFDANDKRVGKVLGTNLSTSVNVYFRVGQRLFILTVLRNRFFGFDELVFMSTNCTGNAFFRVDTDQLAVPIFPKATVSAPGSTIYIEDPNAVAQTILAKSRIRQIDGDCVLVSAQFPAIAAITFSPSIDLDTLFVPPFTVKKDPVTP